MIFLKYLLLIHYFGEDYKANYDIKSSLINASQCLEKLCLAVYNDVLLMYCYFRTIQFRNS